MTEPARDVLSWFWTPLCAVGSHGPAGPNAQICVSVFGASIVPERPRLLVVLSNTNFTTGLVREANSLAVTLLSESQAPLLEPLGLHSGRYGGKLSGVDVRLLAVGDPVFPGGCGFAACHVLETFDLGDSTGFLCAVRERETWNAAPLAWLDARSVVGDEFLRRWAEKSAREQEAARLAMRWLPPR